MLKHPHRDHAIEPPLGIQLIHVGSDHFQIRETATRRLGINKPFLRSGIGNSQKPQRACSLSFLEMNPEPRTPCLDHCRSAEGFQSATKRVRAVSKLSVPKWRSLASFRYRSVCQSKSQ